MMIPSFSFRRYHFRWSLMIAIAVVLGGVLLYVSRSVRIQTYNWGQLPIFVAKIGSCPQL